MGANTVIITLGSQGAVFIDSREPSQCVHVNAKKVDSVVDTTGAGDAFLGALAFSLAKFENKNGLIDHIHYANTVAAYSVQYSGTQTSFPYASDVVLQGEKAESQVL